MVRGHGGDIYGKVIRHDFSVNLNPLGMPEGVVRLLQESVTSWSCYPDTECRMLRRELGKYYGIDPEYVICSNGAAELLFLLVQAKRPKRALVPAPSFSEYEQALSVSGCETIRFPMLEQDGFYPHMQRLIDQLTPDLDLVFFCNPNNPTGVAVPASQVKALAEACWDRGITLVLDECFCEFLDEPERYTMMDALQDYPNVFLLKAFTKLYAMAGLRLGFGICADRELLSSLKQYCQPWNVSVPAQQAGVAALGERMYVERTRKLIATERSVLRMGLEDLGFAVYGSQANYLFFRDGRKFLRESLLDELIRRNILIRDCGNYCGLEDGYYRIGIRLPEENKMLLEHLAGIMKQE